MDLELQLKLGTVKEYYQEPPAKNSLMSPFISYDDNMDVLSQNGELTFVIDGSHKLVKTGSPQKLIDYLIDPSLSDTKFMQVFVFSHKMVIESKAFLKSLLQNLQEGAESNEILKTSRIINVFKYWIENHPEDFLLDTALIGKLSAALETYKNLSSSLGGMVQMLLKLINRKVFML